MKIKIAITDGRIPEDMHRRLRQYGFHVITLPACPMLGEAVSGHTDMLVCRIGNEYISVADYCDTASQVFTDLSAMLPGCRIAFTADTLGATYPEDCRLNVLAMNGFLFAKRDTVSPYLTNKAVEAGLKIVSIRQGYPACTVLKLNERSAITADEGMARTLESHGIAVTRIENGDVSLPPYDYGFIGGTAGVYGNSIYFLGDPETHRSYGRIYRACSDAGLNIVSLGGGRLIDLGGILFADGDIKDYGE